MKILLIEDDPGAAQLVSLALAKADTPFELRTAHRMSEALEAIERGHFDVALADLSLPDSHGLETVTKLHEHAPNLPIVVLTSLACEEMALDSLHLGAQDYLVKDRANTEVLSRAVRYAYQRQQNAQNRKLLAELQTSQELLKKKNRRLARLYKTAQQFVDNVSHEFRTPLTVIKEYVSLLADGLGGEVTEEQRHMLDVVSDRADDLNNMVDDMLDVSKLEAGLLGAWRKNCRVEDIFHHVQPDLARKASIKGVTLQTDLDPDLPDVYCDAEKVGRIVINLTVNAIKFCREPGHVRLWARPDASGNNIIIGVADNGPGIDQQELAHIFERFRQLDTNTHTSTKGFGLGLSIAKELVDLNFGEMNVESEPGRGSTFSFTIPVAQPIAVIERNLHRIGRIRDGSSVVSLVTAEVAPSVESTVAEEVDAFLNYLLRRNDLLFRADTRRWLLVLPVSEVEVQKFFGRVTKTHTDVNRNRPHGPLPEVEVHGLGTWRIADENSDIFACIRDVFRTEEPAHV